MSRLLLIAHSDEAKPDNDPIEVIGNYRAISCGVAPAEDGVEDAPAAATAFLRRTALGTAISISNVPCADDVKYSLR